MQLIIMRQRKIYNTIAERKKKKKKFNNPIMPNKIWRFNYMNQYKTLWEREYEYCSISSPIISTHDNSLYAYTLFVLYWYFIDFSESTMRPVDISGDPIDFGISSFRAESSSILGSSGKYLNLSTCQVHN